MPPVPAHQRDPVGLEPRRLVVVVEVVDHLVAALEDGLHVERRSTVSAAPGTRLRLGQHLAGAQERLGGHAAVEGALAADEVLLDEDDLEARVGQPPGDRPPRRGRHRSRRRRSCAGSWRAVNPGATCVTRPWHPARMLRPAVALALVCRRARRGPVARTRTPRTPPRTPTRRRAPTTTRAARARPRAARPPDAACGWSRSATSTARSTSPRRPATGGGIFVVEQGGRIGVVRGGKRRRHAVPRHPLARSRPAASRACSRWPSRPTTRAVGLLLRLLHRRRRRPSAIVGVPPRRAPTAPTRAARALVLRMDDPEANHNGGLLAVRPRRAALHRHRRRRRRRRPARRARQRAEPRARCSARSCASTRGPSGGRPYTIPASNPFVGRAGRARRDLRLRAAQPVALLVRPRAPATSSSATSARTRSRRSTSSRRAARAGANFGWRPLGGHAAATSTSRRRARSSPVIDAHPRRRATARSPAATSCATAALPGAARPLRLRRLLQRRACARRRCARAGARRAARSAVPAISRRLVVRRGRARARLRRLARRARSTASRAR